MAKVIEFYVPDGFRKRRLWSHAGVPLISTDVRTTLDSLKSLKLYPPHAVLFRQGEPADRIFILCQGKVGLSMRLDCGDRLPLWIAKPGGFWV
jgi:CRP-like cAMP-binding protein